ncbi:MAG: hypothetical protein WC044_03795 [Crocinitomicaceae bacterium]
MSEFSKNFMEWCSTKTNTFIETGTFKGQTTKLSSQFFKNVMTVEINPENYALSKANLNGISNIDMYFGDTNELLADMIQKAEGPITFWLDAHPMDPKVDAACPLIEELDIIAQNLGDKEAIILIDDLHRCLMGDGDYPKLEELEAGLKKINSNYEIKQLPFNTWKVKFGNPTILCGTPFSFEFENSFFMNEKKKKRFIWF